MWHGTRLRPGPELPQRRVRLRQRRLPVGVLLGLDVRAWKSGDRLRDRRRDLWTLSLGSDLLGRWPMLRLRHDLHGRMLFGADVQHGVPGRLRDGRRVLLGLRPDQGGQLFRIGSLSVWGGAGVCDRSGVRERFVCLRRQLVPRRVLRRHGLHDGARRRDVRNERRGVQRLRHFPGGRLHRGCLHVRGQR